MEREQVRLIVMVAAILISIVVFDRLGFWMGMQSYWQGHMIEILMLFALILGAAVYLLSRKKPVGKEPQDFRHVFELWRKHTSSGKWSAIIHEQVDWSRITKTLYPDKLVIYGKFPTGSTASPKWKDLLIMLDPYMEQVSDRNTNEIYFGEFEGIKAREKVKKGEVPMSPIEQMALKSVEKERMEKEVEEKKEEME